MNQHVYGSHGRRAVSRVQVVRPGVAMVCSLGAAIWVVVGGSTFDGRHLVGLLAAVLVMGVFFTRFVDRAMGYYLDHSEAGWRRENTGTWLDPTGYQELFTMRLDPDQGRIYVRGELGEFGTYDEEVEVSTVGMARDLVEDLEMSGVVIPASNAATTSVRARLMTPWG